MLHQHGLLARAPHPDPEADLHADPGLSRQLMYWGRKINLHGYNAHPGEIKELLAREPILLLGAGMFLLATLDLLHRTGFENIHCVQVGADPDLEDTIRSRPESYASFRAYPTREASLESALLDHTPKLALFAGRSFPAGYLKQLNVFFQEYKIPYLAANEDGMEYEIGPFVVPGESACLNCLDIRKASRHKFLAEEEMFQASEALPVGKGDRLVGEDLAGNLVVAGFIAQEAVRVLSGYAPPVFLNNVLYYTPATGELEYARLLRVGHCPACSH